MSEASLKPGVYVVATPIGNLEDITLRAVDILRRADLIAAEDTRRARQLLQHIGRDKAEVVSYYDHVEQEKAPELINRVLRDELSLALISDAGTPCISDPGYRLVRQARQSGVVVHPIPGASALTSLVSASGLPSDRLLFVGFLPTKKVALRREIESWQGMSASIVFYEAPRRLPQVVELLAEIYPKVELVVGRELTKVHEEIVFLTAEEAVLWCERHTHLKGEACVMVALGKQAAGAEESREELEARLSQEAKIHFQNGSTLKDVLSLFRDRGIGRSDLYQLLLEAKESSDDDD